MQFSRRHFLRTSGSIGTVVLGLREARAWFNEPGEGTTTPVKSPFLTGNFGPVHEEVTADRLEIIGKLPAELRGMFVRNGPNPQFTPTGNYHWFDGDGMLHGVRLEDGQASYRNRYVRTAGWQEEREAGKALYGGLADPVDVKRLFQGKPLFKNAANTALVWHDRQPRFACPSLRPWGCTPMAASFGMRSPRIPRSIRSLAKCSFSATRPCRRWCTTAS